MKILSLNMRGWGNTAKRRRLKSLFNSESNGLSGGLLSVWNIGIFTFKFSFTGDDFLGVCIEWNSGLLYIVNIYSPCSLSGGDFNVVLKVWERRGSSGGGGQAERDNFAHFTDVMEVVDVPVMGKKFS
ncbi:hypothetical protein L195_g048630 [Trifolium pratense]|uniref:Endonuclease/exonuclease/phosphatase family protein n=1 Tax=Trifolium pratense TaxID=57577 RepID=A0A2K3JLU8_TRIPR|nr:hypothetical protein L195_g048630 [Trifolium pratense]